MLSSTQLDTHLYFLLLPNLYRHFNALWEKEGTFPTLPVEAVLLCKRLQDLLFYKESKAQHKARLVFLYSSLEAAV